MSKATAYAPCALSFIFQPWITNDMVCSGSTGIGCTLQQGVTATVQPSDATVVYLNGSVITLPTLTAAVSTVTSQACSITLQTPLPLASGFGVSGAATIATLWALRRLLGLKQTDAELTKIAHICEIKHRTGLGTVGTITTGGFLIKLRPGLPVRAKRLPFIGQRLYSFVRGPIITNTVLSRNTNQINAAAESILARINTMQSPRLEDIIDASFVFANTAGLLPDKMRRSLQTIHQAGGHATMHMLGDAIVSTTDAVIYPDATKYEITITDDTVHTV